MTGEKNTPASDIRRWRKVGERLAEAQASRSNREMARRAEFSEGTWRLLLQGYEQRHGHKLPINPSDQKLFAASIAAGLDPHELFALVGRTVPQYLVDEYEARRDVTYSVPNGVDLTDEEWAKVKEYMEFVRATRPSTSGE